LLTLLCPAANYPVFARRIRAAQPRGIAAFSLCSTGMVDWQNNDGAWNIYYRDKTPT
jgi:hypothetical protein